MSEKYLYVVIAFLSLVLLYQCMCDGKKTKEGYDGQWINVGLNPNMTQRPEFNTNLDPRYQFARSANDPFGSSGGYIRGEMPSSDYLGSVNDFRGDQSIEPIKEGFGQILKGEYPGVADSATYINRDFAKMAQDVKLPVNKESAAPNTLEYTTPKELLPIPDMRQTLMRDPSDPTNFMYDRTLFAPLKSRNHNTPDRFRGDLDIKPIKTGWFDIATVPHVDLAQGYFGYFNDIEQYQDLQDISNIRRRDIGDSDKMASSGAIDNIYKNIASDMERPRQAYARNPPLKMPVEGTPISPFGENAGALNP